MTYAPASRRTPERLTWRRHVDLCRLGSMSCRDLMSGRRSMSGRTGA